MTEIYIPKQGASFRSDIFSGENIRKFDGFILTDRTVQGHGATAIDAANILVTFLGNVSAGIVAAALYDALTGKTEWIRIAGKKTQVTEKDIKKALEEENQIEPKNTEDD